MAAPKSYRVRHLKKRQFLDAFAMMGNISAAARAAGIDRSTYHYWVEHDEQFALSVNIANTEATERLEAEAWERATAGSFKPVYQGGALVGHVMEKSDTLLIFLLKARAPGKYRERSSGQSDEADRVKVYADLDLGEV